MKANQICAQWVEEKAAAVAEMQIECRFNFSTKSANN